MNGEQLRQKRMAEGIAGALLSSRAGIDRASLSLIERYAKASEDELERLIRTRLNCSGSTRQFAGKHTGFNRTRRESWGCLQSMKRPNDATGLDDARPTKQRL